MAEPMSNPATTTASSSTTRRAFGGHGLGRLLGQHDQGARHDAL
jgi:hypothetical protein